MKRKIGRTWWESRCGGRIKKIKQSYGVERRSRVRRARPRRRSKGSRRRMLDFHWNLKSSMTAVSRLRIYCLSVFHGASMEQRVHSTSPWKNKILVSCGSYSPPPPPWHSDAGSLPTHHALSHQLFEGKFEGEWWLKECSELSQLNALGYRVINFVFSR